MAVVAAVAVFTAAVMIAVAIKNLGSLRCRPILAAMPSTMAPRCSSPRGAALLLVEISRRMVFLPSATSSSPMILVDHGKPTFSAIVHLSNTICSMDLALTVTLTASFPDTRTGK